MHLMQHNKWQSDYECLVGKKASVNCLGMCRLDFGSFFFVIVVLIPY